MPLNVPLLQVVSSTGSTTVTTGALSLDGFQAATLELLAYGVAGAATCAVSLQASPDGVNWATVPAGFWLGSSAPTSQNANGLAIWPLANPMPEIGLCRLSAAFTGAGTISVTGSLLAR
jgi:hypothetical protein